MTSDLTCTGLTNGVNSDIININPLLSPLANNGGPTLTMLPAANSPAVNAGGATCGVSTDQRGVARPQGSQCDIGAVELMANDTTPPSCAMTQNPTVVSGHTQIQVTVQDTGTGIQTIASAGTVNATLSFNPTPAPGTTSPVVVTAVKTTEGQKTTVLLQITDVAGNSTACDPVLTELGASPWSSVERQTFRGVDGAERWATVQNGTPGLRAVRLLVNGDEHWFRNLRDGEERLRDIAASLRPGNDNVIIIEAVAVPGGARVMIGDLP
ncbi:MAG: hypothetical protein NTZ05_15775, partial [Chloroflexi bacterium]|nr:hypothetical protein [Chloroflexota bacterium]